MDVERRAYYDAIAGFQVGGVNPFDDTSYERDMVRQAARTPAIQPAPFPLLPPGSITLQLPFHRFHSLPFTPRNDKRLFFNCCFYNCFQVFVDEYTCIGE